LQLSFAKLVKDSMMNTLESLTSFAKLSCNSFDLQRQEKTQ